MMNKEFLLGQVANASGGNCMVMVVQERQYDIAALGALLGVEEVPSSMAEALADWDHSLGLLLGLRARMDDALDRVQTCEVRGATVLSPVPRPGKVLCAAANYSAHVAEMAQTGFTGPSGSASQPPKRPERPYHFLKASSCMIGPNDDVVLPSADHRIDWEVELAAVIGRPTKSVNSEGSLFQVAGYTIVNDVSCRAATWREDRPNIRSDWLSGKSYDTFLPTGPWFLPAVFVEDYRDLRLQLWVNGELQQDGVAREMIFSLEEQIEYLSAMLTLEPGDMIATGTPAGVGQGKGMYLVPGDLVEAEITGMGRQRNLVRV